MEWHPAACIFPMMDDDDLQRLADDIRDNGLQLPIIVDDQERIIDGRNRNIACVMAGVEPEYEQFNGEDPATAVISLNLERRHLTSSQRAMAAAKAESLLAELQAEAEKRMKAGISDPPQKIEEGTDRVAYETTSIAADLFGTNRQYVHDAKAIKDKSPQIAEKVDKGELTIPQAKREIVRAERLDHLRQLEEIPQPEFEGLYNVAVIDPPWPMTKIELDVSPNQVEFDYPTMTEAELAAMELPLADDAHVWIWTTQRFLPMAFRLLGPWQLKYVCLFTWLKPGGFQPFGLPQYNTEFAIYARRGAPEFVDTKSFFTGFRADRSGHSVKPSDFYDVVRRVTAGKRIDIFNRRPIAGFDTWGKEAAR